MKSIKTFLLICALMLMASLPSIAQFSPIRVVPAISGTPTTVFIVPGSTTTNIPASLQVACPIGALGYGVTFNFAGTNATATTNATFTFEISGDGVCYATNSRPTFLVNPIGVQYAPYFTNVLNTNPNSANAAFIRLISIQNTNTTSLFITNLSVSYR